jgi:hypothetical protein
VTTDRRDAALDACKRDDGREGGLLSFDREQKSQADQ